jgi:hypothetical protein
MREISTKEIANAQKVQSYLSNIDSVSYENIREDIFKVKCEDFTAIVDAEDSIICIELPVMAISDIKDPTWETRGKLATVLLEENSKSIHGKFAISGDKIVIKENLEAENMDANEFEAALAWVFGKAENSIEKIAAIVG